MADKPIGAALGEPHVVEIVIRAQDVMVAKRLEIWIREIVSLIPDAKIDAAGVYPASVFDAPDVEGAPV